MIVKNLEYSRKFVKKLKKLPFHIVKVAGEKEKMFKENPLHPSLRLHELSGQLNALWSISITDSYRIIFQRQENGDIVFVSIGRHDIYKYL